MGFLNAAWNDHVVQEISLMLSHSVRMTAEDWSATMAGRAQMPLLPRTRPVVGHWESDTWLSSVANMQRCYMIRPIAWHAALV